MTQTNFNVTQKSSTEGIKDCLTHLEDTNQDVTAAQEDF